MARKKKKSRRPKSSSPVQSAPVYNSGAKRKVALELLVLYMHKLKPELRVDPVAQF